jgi:hypothetical protein
MVRTIVPSLFTLLAAVLISGCSHVDRFGSKMDMMASRLVSAKAPLYEGTLRISRPIGAMVAMQFEDGRNFDVVRSPAAVQPGDILRIHETEEGYEAILWRANDSVALKNRSKIVTPH